jgi:hypothetical protein
MTHKSRKTALISSKPLKMKERDADKIKKIDEQTKQIFPFPDSFLVAENLP